MHVMYVYVSLVFSPTFILSDVFFQREVESIVRYPL